MGKKIALKTKKNMFPTQCKENCKNFLKAATWCAYAAGLVLYFVYLLALLFGKTPSGYSLSAAVILFFLGAVGRGFLTDNRQEYSRRVGTFLMDIFRTIMGALVFSIVMTVTCIYLGGIVGIYPFNNLDNYVIFHVIGVLFLIIFIGIGYYARKKYSAIWKDNFKRLVIPFKDIIKFAAAITPLVVLMEKFSPALKAIIGQLLRGSL